MNSPEPKTPRSDNAAQPGTQGPEGHLDDQPQREDEYLSHLLRDFNPQRLDTKSLPAAKRDQEIEDTSQKDHPRTGSQDASQKSGES